MAPPFTVEERDAMSKMDPEFEKAVEARPYLDFINDIAGFRAARDARLQSLRRIPNRIPEVQEEDIMIPVRDSQQIKIRIYKPTSPPQGGSPLIVLYHEGAYWVGGLNDHDDDARMFSRDLSAVCVNVEYGLAPEHPFPKGINDAWDALQWIAANASKKLSADPSLGFIVGGISAGGAYSAILTHIARDEKLNPPLTGAWLAVPQTTNPAAPPAKYAQEYTAWKSNTNDPVLKHGGQARTLVPGNLRADYSSPLSNVMIWPEEKGGHRNLPPAYLQICGMDPLRDDGLVYERVLREEAGVKTRMDVYSGFGHCFWTNWPEMDASKKFVADELEGIKWLLAETPGYLKSKP